MFVAGRISDIMQAHIRRRIVIYLFVVVIFAMGLVLGTLSVRAVDTSQRAQMATYLDGFFRSISGADISKETLARQAIVNDILKTVGLMFVFGLSIVGVPLVLVIVFLRGFVLGFTASFMVHEMVLKGAAVALVSLLPQNIFAIPAIVVAGTACLAFGTSAAKVLLGRAVQTPIATQLVGFTFAIVLSSALLLCGAFVEAYVTPVLVDTVRTFLL